MPMQVVLALQWQYSSPTVDNQHGVDRPSLASSIVGSTTTVLVLNLTTSRRYCRSSWTIKPLFSSRNLDFGATVAPSFLFGN